MSGSYLNFLHMNELEKSYKEAVRPKLQKALRCKNLFSVPKLEKVVINVGASRALSDSSFYDVMENVLRRISGQKPVATKAKKSIANFKIREGMVVGYKVTLRGHRMYDFVHKLISVTLPRVRDFQGLNPKSFDGKGNYCIGFKEYVAFPEIKSDEIEKLHGLEVMISTTAKTDDEGFLLLQELGFPFQERKTKK